eukprot:COSAG06_NODE_22821_length_711_cov_2.349673_2_plen_89_part_00
MTSSVSSPSFVFASLLALSRLARAWATAMRPWQPAGAVARGARPQYALGTFGRCYLGILGVLTKVLILGSIPTRMKYVLYQGPQYVNG